jgi:hypothetical protein
MAWKLRLTKLGFVGRKFWNFTEKIMRKLILSLCAAVGLVSGPLIVSTQAQPQVVLAWDAITNSSLLGYNLVWGTNSGVYFATNTYPPTQTTATISNLQFGIPYYFAIYAYGSLNTTGPMSPELSYISNAPGVIVASNNPDDLPLPPSPQEIGRGGTTPGGTGKSGNVAGGSGQGSGSGAGATGPGASSTNITQAQIWGIPPVLNMTVSNTQAYLAVGGTVGATFAVQSCNSSTSDPSLPSSWITFTNITLTNAAPIGSNAVPGAPVDAIDLAYVPGIQTVAVPTIGNSGDLVLHRVVMSNDYPILASIVMKPKGYQTRLVLVNMPGLPTPDDCCFVSQAGSFIHYNSSNSVLQLEGSGSTIRQIATTMAKNLNTDWTTASEFVYSNGMGQILATVVEADPPSSDPVAGTTPTSSIVINF